MFVVSLSFSHTSLDSLDMAEAAFADALAHLGLEGQVVGD